MLTATCLVIIFAALFEHYGAQAVTNPGTPELRQYYHDTMRFRWETVSRLDEYLARGTTYYSPSKGWYRFDADDGENQLFVFPELETAVHYFPYFEYSTMSQGLKCWKMTLQQVGRPLPSPFPSTEVGYSQAGDGEYEGKMVPKFVRIEKNKVEGIDYIEERTILYPNLYPNQYPLQSEFKHWIANSRGEKNRLIKHEVTDYFGIVPHGVSENIWTSPEGRWPLEDPRCIQVQPNSYEEQAITGHADVVHAPKRIFKDESPQYRTGGVQYNTSMPSANADDVLVTHFRNVEIDYDEELPAKFDWRDSGAVTSVKNQRDCGSCWAFGVVAALESAHFLKSGQSVVLSEQFLIDCDWTGSNSGCAGGTPEEAFKWIQHVHGIPLSADYGPYKNMNGKCSFNNPPGHLHGAMVGVRKIPPNDPKALKYHLKNLGPILVHVMAKPMFSYTSGIINTPCDDPTMKDHYVLIVGYGETEDNEPYWMVKNSWGNSWGMDGYFRVSAKPDENCICILDSPLFPELEDIDTTQTWY